MKNEEKLKQVSKLTCKIANILQQDINAIEGATVEDKWSICDSVLGITLTKYLLISEIDPNIFFDSVLTGMQLMIKPNYIKGL